MALSESTGAETFNIITRGSELVLTSDSSGITRVIAELVDYNNRTTQLPALSVLDQSSDLDSSSDFSFFVEEEISNLLDFTLNELDASTITIDTEAYGRYALRCWEVTESGGVLSTDYDVDATSVGSYDSDYDLGTYFNISLSEHEYLKGDFDEVQLLVTGFPYNLLTTQPTDGINIQLDQSQFITFLRTNGTTEAEVRTYDSSGSNLTTSLLDLTGLSTTAYYYRVPIGTKNLALTGISFTGVSYYTVRIKHNSSYSEEYRYNIVPSCNDDVRIHWVSKWGCQDSYTFQGAFKKSISSNYNTYQKAIGGELNSTTVRNTGVQNAFSDIERSYTVHTKTVNSETIDWLSEMVINNKAWIELNNEYYPIIIENTSVDLEDSEDYVGQFSLTFRRSHKQKSAKW